MPTLLVIGLVVGALAIGAGIVLYAFNLIPPLLIKLAIGLFTALGAVTGILSRRPVADWLGYELRQANIRLVAISAVIAAVILGTIAITVTGIAQTTRTTHTSNTSNATIADWSKWGATGQWHIEHSTQTFNGLTTKEVLVSDGSAPCCDPNLIGLVSPDNAPDGDYAIEARIQIFGSNPTATAGEVYMGLLVQSDQSRDGYLYGILDNSPTPHPGMTFVSDLGSGAGPQSGQPYPLDSGVHVYRIEVQGFTTRLLIDGKLMLQTPNSAYSEARAFGLIDSGYQLKVLMLTVTPLGG